MGKPRFRSVLNVTSFFLWMYPAWGGCTPSGILSRATKEEHRKVAVGPEMSTGPSKGKVNI